MHGLICPWRTRGGIYRRSDGRAAGRKIRAAPRAAFNPAIPDPCAVGLGNSGALGEAGRPEGWPWSGGCPRGCHDLAAVGVVALVDELLEAVSCASTSSTPLRERRRQISEVVEVALGRVLLTPGAHVPA